MKIIITTALIMSVILGWIAKPEYEEKSLSIEIKEPKETDNKLRAKLPEPTPEKPKEVSKIALVLPSQEEVAEKIREVFAEDPETAVAVFRAESGLRPDAQGWNCRYNGISKACLPEDRASAWSVDCGVAQINTPGNTCPEHLYEVETNLAEAYKKYVRRKWQPWVAHNQGKHLVFLQ